METKATQFYFNYDIIPEHNLLIESFNGTLTLDLMKKIKSNESKDEYFKPELNVIADVRQLTFDGTTEQVTEYLNFAITHGSIMGKRKTAVIFATPNQHVYSNIFSKVSNNTQMAVHHFQEVKSALKWINCDKAHDEVENMLHEIRAKSFLVE